MFTLSQGASVQCSLLLYCQICSFLNHKSQLQMVLLLLCIHRRMNTWCTVCLICPWTSALCFSAASSEPCVCAAEAARLSMQLDFRTTVQLKLLACFKFQTLPWVLWALEGSRENVQIVFSAALSLTDRNLSCYDHTLHLKRPFQFLVRASVSKDPNMSELHTWWETFWKFEGTHQPKKEITRTWVSLLLRWGWRC